MLGGSALAGLPFLFKASRHSSRFYKSSVDETNPVASLCETPPSNSPPAVHPPTSSLLSLSVEIVGGRWGSWFPVWAFLLPFGRWFQFNAPNLKKKESIWSGCVPWATWAEQSRGNDADKMQKADKGTKRDNNNYGRTYKNLNKRN